jgi:CheY-specific phosphatase CheX
MSMTKTDYESLQQMILGATRESMMEIVTTMLFLPVTLDHGVAKPSRVTHVAAPAEISVVVEFFGAMSGGVRLACSVDIARKLASGLAGEGFNSMTSDARDAFAEIGNMVAGGIQTRLETAQACRRWSDSTPAIRANGLQLSPPSVAFDTAGIVEDSLLVPVEEQQCRMESVRQFFRIGDQPFIVEVYYTPPGDAALLDEATDDVPDDMPDDDDDAVVMASSAPFDPWSSLYSVRMNTTPEPVRGHRLLLQRQPRGMTSHAASC